MQFITLILKIGKSTIILKIYKIKKSKRFHLNVIKKEYSDFIFPSKAKERRKLLDEKVKEYIKIWN